MSDYIRTNDLSLDTRSWLPIPHGTCDGGDCGRRAVSFAYSERISALIPVCRRHILAYRVFDPPVQGHRYAQWQAEDEYANLRFCRRSRWKWLAQWRILRDQRAAVVGRVSRAQRKLIARAATPGGDS